MRLKVLASVFAEFEFCRIEFSKNSCIISTTSRGLLTVVLNVFFKSSLSRLMSFETDFCSAT